MSSGSSVIKPFSKFLLVSFFAPMPAPVRLALPLYANLPSIITILKCTRGQSTLSIPANNPGYLSKSLRKAGPGSFACIRRISTFRFIISDNTSRKGTILPDFAMYMSLISAVPIHINFLALVMFSRITFS